MIFLYFELRRYQGQPQAIDIRLQPHQSMRGKCSQCLRSAPGYDRLEERTWLFVPLWGIATYFRYAPRRVQCAEHGIVVEAIPWSEGKRPVTRTMMGFLARWTRRLSWKETAQVFQTSWENVYRSVEWFVEWGLAQRKLEGVRSLGVSRWPQLTLSFGNRSTRAVVDYNKILREEKNEEEPQQYCRHAGRQRRMSELERARRPNR